MTARLSSRHRSEAEGSGFLRENDGQEKGCYVVGGCSEVHFVVVKPCHAMVDAAVTFLLPISPGSYFMVLRRSDTRRIQLQGYIPNKYLDLAEFSSDSWLLPWKSLSDTITTGGLGDRRRL